MLRWFRRRVPLGTIDQSLDALRVENDPARRAAEVEHLRDLLAVFHDAAGDAAMRAVISMEDRLGNLVREALGETNELVGQSVSYARGAEEGTGNLQSQLSALEGRFSEYGETVSEHTAQLAEHAAQLASHETRLRHLEAYAAGVPDDERQRIISLVKTDEQRYEEIMRQLADIRAQLGGRADAAGA